MKIVKDMRSNNDFMSKVVNEIDSKLDNRFSHIPNSSPTIIKDHYTLGLAKSK